MPKMLAPGFRTRRSSSFIRFGALAALVLFAFWSFSNRSPAPSLLPIQKSQPAAADGADSFPAKAAEQPVCFNCAGLVTRANLGSSQTNLYRALIRLTSSLTTAENDTKISCPENRIPLKKQPKRTVNAVVVIPRQVSTNGGISPSRTTPSWWKSSGIRFTTILTRFGAFLNLLSEKRRTALRCRSTFETARLIQRVIGSGR